jgi:hypothetical protein
MGYHNKKVTEIELVSCLSDSKPLSINQIKEHLLQDGVTYGDMYLDLPNHTLFITGLDANIEASEEFEFMLYKADFYRVFYHWPDGTYMMRHLDSVRFPNGEIETGECRLIKATKGVVDV